MNNRVDDRSPEQPRSEPEILPPERAEAVRGRSGRPLSDDVFVFTQQDFGASYRTVKLPSPLAMWLILITVGLIAGAVLMLALGFVLFLVPVAVVAIALLVLSGRIYAWWNGFGAGPRA